MTRKYKKLKGQDSLEFVATLFWPLLMTWLFIAISFTWYAIQTNSAVSLEAASKGRNQGITSVESFANQMSPSSDSFIIRTTSKISSNFLGYFDRYFVVSDISQLLGLPGGTRVGDSSVRNLTVSPLWIYSK